MMRKTNCPECGVQTIWMPTRKFPHVETMVEACSVNRGDIEFDPDHLVPHLPRCPAFVYHCQLCGETAYGVALLTTWDGKTTHLQRDGVFCRACAKQHQPMADRPEVLHHREFCLMHIKEDGCGLPLPTTAGKD